MRLYSIILLILLVSVPDCFASTISATKQSVALSANQLTTIDFTYSPATPCAGTSVTFTPSINGNGYTFNWDFGDTSTSSLASPTHIFDSFGTGTKTFSVKLTVSDKDTTLSVTKDIIVTQSPDPTLNGTGSGEFFNGTPAFKVCSNTISTFFFTNASTTKATNTRYTINWGDGSADFIQTDWTSTTHTYQIGLWYLKYTVEGSNSCPVTKTYIVFVGSNPAVSLGNPGNTDICSNNVVEFPITGTQNNPPGTTYTVTFNDGSTEQVFNHPPPASVKHTFVKSSCGTTSSNGTIAFPNSFSANIVASNPCGTSAVGVVPIYVSTTPIADFILPKTSTCTNIPICILDTTQGGTIATATKCLSPNIVWTITPSTGVTLASGTFGNDMGLSDPSLWTSGSEQICPQFSIPGTYTIALKTGNRCGVINQKEKTICVEAPLVPQFTVNNESGCAPLDVTITNTTDVSKSCVPPTYSWAISYTAANCGTSSAFNYTSGTSTSASPSIRFTNPGKYTLTLTTTSTCGTLSFSKIITVKKPPTVSINTIPTACGTASITPTAVINSCTPETGTLTYAWSFPGGTPATSSSQNPGTVTYSAPGTYKVFLTVKNECNVAVSDSTSLQVKEVPTVTNTSLAQTICSGFPTVAIPLTASLSGTTFTWTATGTAGTSGYTAGSGNTIPAQTLYTTGTTPGTVTFTITPSNGCTGPVTNYVVTVNPAPRVKDQPQSSYVCLGGKATDLSVTYENGTGTPSYQWYSNILNDNQTGIIIPGATFSAYTPSVDKAGTTYYYCKISLPSSECSDLVSNTAFVTVDSIPVIKTQPVTNQQVCVGGAIKSPLTLSVKGGAGTVIYQWYQNTTNTNNGGTPISGATLSTFTPPAFTSTGKYYYYVEVSYSGNNCGKVTSNTAEIEVVADPEVTKQPLASQELCQNTSSEALSVSVSGGLGAFAYQWFRNSANNTTSGTSITGANDSVYIPSTSTIGTTYYYCIITQPNGPGCNAVTSTSMVKVNAAPTITKQPESSTVCLGNAATTLSVTYTNGVGTPSYQWYSNSTNSNLTGTPISGATGATNTPRTDSVSTIYYYCIIKLSSGGCDIMVSNTASVTVNAYPVITDTTIEVASEVPFNYTPVNSGANIVPVGTTYTWSAPVIAPAGTLTGGSAQSIPQSAISQTLKNTTTSPATATYTVTPSANGCTGQPFKLTVNVTPLINPKAVVTNSTCYGVNNGSIQTSIEGGMPFTTGDPYHITWSGPNGFTSTTATITNLAPGVYTLKIEDASSRPFTTTYTVTQPAEMAIQTDSQKDVSCNGANNGSISITVSGGTPPYIYNWTKDGANFSTSEDISGLARGTYVVSITDKNNCSPKTASYSIIEPTGLSVVLISQTELKCNGDSTGVILIQASGGTPIEKTPGVFDYNYAWTGPNGFTSTKANQTGLFAGNYHVTVTDKNGCTQNLSVSINQPPAIDIKVTTTPITCYGDNNASIKLDVTGGIPPYSAQWSDFSQGLYEDNLSAGNYIITVTDANNCHKTIQVNIPEATLFKVSPVVKNVSCHGAHNGSISLNFVGGKAPVKLVWEDNPTAGTTRNNLGPGAYTVTITDAQPCNIYRTFVIQEPDELVLTASITDALDCNNISSGAIDLTVNGGTPPFSYSWSNGKTTQDLTNLIAGTYIVTVTDSSGCTKTAQYTVKRPAPLTVNVVEKRNYNCSTGVLSQINTAQVTGGVPPYLFTWSGGTISGANGEIMETTQNGIVLLHVKDAIGCTTDYSFDVTIPFAGISYQLLDCNAHTFQFDAVSPFDQSGGDSYSWDFGDGGSSTSKSPSHSFAKAGSYRVRVTVKDILCNAVYEQIVVAEESPTLKLDREPVFCQGDTMTVHVSGADSYRWANGSTADSMKIYEVGSYSVIGISKAGCSGSLNFTAKYLGLFNYTIQTDKDEITPESPTIQVWTEDIPGSLYFWDFDDSTQVQGNHLEHTFNITHDGFYTIKLKVINPNGCTEWATKRIWLTGPQLPNTFTPNGDGDNDIFMKNWHIQIFNRNGLLLYEGTEGWDGTYKGKHVSNDTYFYVLQYLTKSGLKYKTGYVTVVR
ncbi:MAG: PKD domain-containing protein [Bacteroidota bacterium]|nr:PKD domain-containing protein [Bacteroidota bacterium]